MKSVCSSERLLWLPPAHDDVFKWKRLHITARLKGVYHLPRDYLGKDFILFIASDVTDKLLHELSLSGARLPSL